MQSLQGKSILLVDDEPNVLKSFSRELVSDNHSLSVSVATNGEDAINGIAKGYYDLVVTDLLMPGVDGFQVLKAAKRRNEHIKVIILTGYGDLKYAIDALRLGADDYLLKPCDVDELVYRISNCIAKQDLQRRVSMFESLLPICCYCKKIRADKPDAAGKGLWMPLEEYFKKVKGVNCSHGCCPECFEKELPEIIR